MTTTVKFETAKLLKSKGFYKSGYLQDVWLGNTFKKAKGRFIETPVFGLGSSSVLPTISDVVMWLYDNHGIFICPTPFCNTDVQRFSSDIYLKSNKKISAGHSKNPIEAYEVAIEYTLNKLLKEIK